MADISTDIAAWSGTPGSNLPAGGTNVGTGLDDNLRALQAAVVLALNAKGSDKASATTTDLSATDGLFHDVTGTTTITGFGTVRAGVWKVLKFEGALTLTHNATSLILPGGANITTAVGDIALVTSEGSGNWRCVAYQKVTGGNVSGGVIQRVYDEYLTYGNTASVIPADDSIPQVGEGTELIAGTGITPKSASSKLRITVVVPCTADGAAICAAAVFRDGGANAVAAGWAYIASAGETQTISIQREVATGSAVSTTFSLRVGPSANTMYINGNTANRIFGGVSAASLIIEEVI